MAEIGQPERAPDGDAPPDRRRWLTRAVLIGGTVAAVALVALLLFAGANAYTVKARFLNAGQLVRGNPVQTGGTPIGSVKGIRITDEGRAEIELEIDDDYAPLREGTRAAIRQSSQSGIANRYVDLTFPAAGRPALADGGLIDTDETKTQVDLDELFKTLDAETRESLQRFLEGSAEMFRDRGEQARRGFRYLNPALSTGGRLFRELSEDTPRLERFLIDSARLVTALAERRDDLAGLVSNLNETTRALGDRKQALADAIAELPPFMRRANTTFVNLRAALDEVDPLVEASGPVARRLGPFLAQARAFAADAGPTVRDLSRTIRRRGRSNDLIELLRSVPPLADIALVTKRRSVSPGGRAVDVGVTRGAFPETVEAFRRGAPEIAFARPYTLDLLGWFDDFSETGPGFDALGALSRGHVSVAENLPLPPGPGPVRQDQYHRCPGAAEAPASDGSNVLSPEERERLLCDEDHRATGDVE